MNIVESIESWKFCYKRPMRTNVFQMKFINKNNTFIKLQYKKFMNFGYSTYLPIQKNLTMKMKGMGLSLWKEDNSNKFIGEKKVGTNILLNKVDY